MGRCQLTPPTKNLQFFRNQFRNKYIGELPQFRERVCCGLLLI
jgi:hypothetical protein